MAVRSGGPGPVGGPGSYGLSKSDFKGTIGRGQDSNGGNGGRDSRRNGGSKAAEAAGRRTGRDRAGRTFGGDPGQVAQDDVPEGTISIDPSVSRKYADFQEVEGPPQLTTGRGLTEWAKGVLSRGRATPYEAETLAEGVRGKRFQEVTEGATGVLGFASPPAALLARGGAYVYGQTQPAAFQGGQESVTGADTTSGAVRTGLNIAANVLGAGGLPRAAQTAGTLAQASERSWPYVL